MSSMSASSCCSARKFSEARSCGYASETAEDRVGLCGGCRSARLLGGRPCLRHRVERLPLVLCVGLHRLDEIGHEVEAPPELDVDVCPAGPGLVPQPDEPVEGQDEEEDDDGSYRAHDDCDNQGDRDTRSQWPERSWTWW